MTVISSQRVFKAIGCRGPTLAYGEEMPFRSCQVNDPWLVLYFFLSIEGTEPSRKPFVKKDLTKTLSISDVSSSSIITNPFARSLFSFKILSMTSVFQRVPETGYPSYASLDRPPHGLRNLYNPPTVPTPPSFRFALLLDFVCPSCSKDPPIYSSLVFDNYGHDNGFNYSRIQPSTQFYHRKRLCLYQKRT